LDYVQTVCISLHADSHAKTSTLNFYRLDALVHVFMPNRQYQSTESNHVGYVITNMLIMSSDAVRTGFSNNVG